MISIVVPTYNESGNVVVIANAIRQVLTDIDYELLYIDDSTDDTPEILARLTQTDTRTRFIHRTKARGLATAVMLGFERANGEYITVMDADLQHPPSMLPSLVRELDNGADIVIPSRFIPGGDDGGLRFHRKVVSALARYIGKAAIKKLRPVSDPTGGFFAFRKTVITGVQLKPIGWKILIEILVRGLYSKVTEIPYRFQPRHAGTSKLSIKEQWNYIRHLAILALASKEDRRFLVFIAVGLSGVVINTGAFWAFVRLHQNISLSGFMSAFVALVSNFTFNDLFTWSDIKQDAWVIRVLKYFATSLVGIGINVAVLDGLYYRTHVHYIIANLTGIACATVWNYFVNNVWTWKSKNKSQIHISQIAPVIKSSVESSIDAIVSRTIH